MVQIALGTMFAGRPPTVAPVNSVAPVITGDTEAGSVLSLDTPGTWSGYPAPTLTYQWQVNGEDVVGETDETGFDTTGFNADDAVTLDEIGTNTGGSATATSNTITLTASADVTAPVLSSPTDASAGTTTAAIGVTTDEGNGTLYWVISTASNAPSKAQVKAGQMHTGAAAADSGSQAVSGTGVQTVSPNPSGLTPETGYFAHFMHEDAATNQSNVASANGFTTDGNVTSFVGNAAAAASTVTIPTHLAPTGTQKDLIISFFVGQVIQTPPTLPAGVGYTAVTLPNSGGAASVGSSWTVGVKYASTASEEFGTNDASTPRCAVAVFRLTNAPADPLDALTGINDEYQNNAATNTWADVTPSEASWVITAMHQVANQAPASRDDITDIVTGGTSGNRIRIGRSTDGTETAWEVQTPAVSGATDTGSVAIGVIP